jgi:Methyltransferase domain
MPRPGRNGSHIASSLSGVDRLQSIARNAVTRFSIFSRQRKARLISDWMTEKDCHTLLFVGCLGEEDEPPNSNIVENLISDGRQVIMGINLYHRTTSHPFMIADGRRMPFPDKYVDFALANAIIEHVGNESDQAMLVAEHCRVARCWAITTPNRWFPVESHTATLFRHWSPKWRSIERADFTRLLSLSEFRRLLPSGTVVVGHWWSPTFTALYCAD